MKYKKSLIFICLIICLFSIASVCAGDVNDTLAIDDGWQIEPDSADDNIKVIEENGGADKTDNGTFKALQEKISDASGSTITLKNDYRYDESVDGGRITLSKSITIDGGGHAIDGNHRTGIFHVDNECKVVLMNIIFKNGNANGSGGAIMSYSSYSCDIYNCTFTDCHSQEYGGAISLNGRDGNCINCTFTDCHSQGYGGAIYNLGGGTGDYINCTFTNCHSEQGGAVCLNGCINNCTFIDCYSSILVERFYLKVIV